MPGLSLLMEIYNGLVRTLRLRTRTETPLSRRCPHKLATALGFAPAEYDLRSNQGGIAVSGEITLHHERVYVQVSQPATGADTGILIRTCAGRRDYTGGRNHYAPLSLLDDVPALAARVRAVVSVRTPAVRS